MYKSALCKNMMDYNLWLKEEVKGPQYRDWVWSRRELTDFSFP